MITVENLTKRFGDSVAVDGVSFSVGDGEILGFLGPNGAGKTTTMRMLTGYMPATSGTAAVEGFDIHRQPDQVRSRIGYLPEHPPLYMELRVDAYLDFVARIKGLAGKARKEAIGTIIERCGLTSVRTQVIRHLSKGYRQRVGLAQALVHNPPVLILDEPTIGLDPAQIVEIRGLIRALKGDHTVILSTHILPEVTQICDRVVIINRGRIVGDDTPENLSAAITRPGRMFLELASAEGAAEAIGSLPEVESVEPVSGRAGAFWVLAHPDEDVTGKLADLAADRGWGLKELRRDQVTLEEAYIRLTSA